MSSQADRALQPGGRAGNASALDRWLLRTMMDAMPGAGYEVVLWDGSSAGDKTGLRVHIRDRGALRHLVRHPAVHFGDLYSAGRIEVEGDLVTFLERTYLAQEAGRVARASAWWRVWTEQAPRASSIEAARTNIHRHYDLGNDFYALWLDREAMQYTCAYFPVRGHDAGGGAARQDGPRLPQAAPATRPARVRGGLRLGRLRAAHGARLRRRGARLEHLARAGPLRDRVRAPRGPGWPRRRSSRTTTATCAASATSSSPWACSSTSGPENYGVLGAVIDRCLAPNGLGLIHTIGRNRPEPMNGWIERRIFPGAQPPSLGQMAAIFEPRAFSILDVENLRLHYAQTLRHWTARYLEAIERVRADRGDWFARAWHLYLAGSTAAFNAGTMQLFQVLFARAGNNDLPPTRAHLYA